MINVIIDLFLSSPGGVGKLFACVFVVLFCFLVETDWKCRRMQGYNHFDTGLS